MARKDYDVGAGRFYRLTDFTDKRQRVADYIIYMLSRTAQMFEYDGLPETIPRLNLERLIQTHGHVCVTEVNGELYAFFGGMGGEPNPYYMPTIYTVANPALLFDANLVIGEECEVIYNDSMWYGLMPLFRRYASLLVENDISMRMVNVNSRVSMLIKTQSEREASSARQFLCDIEAGKQGVCAESSFVEGLNTLPYSTPSSGRDVTSLIEYQQYLKASWFNELGLNANYNMKREAINSEEAQLNEDALLPLVDDMLACRQECLDKVNAMYGTNISVKFKSAWKINNEEMNEPVEHEEIEEVENDETD